MKVIQIVRTAAGPTVFYDTEWHLKSLENSYRVFQYQLKDLEEAMARLRGAAEGTEREKRDRLISIQIWAQAVVSAIKKIMDDIENVKNSAVSLIYVGGNYVYKIVDDEPDSNFNMEDFRQAFGKAWNPDITLQNGNYILTEKGAEIARAYIEQYNAGVTDESQKIKVKIVPLMYGTGYDPSKPEEHAQRHPWPGKPVEENESEEPHVSASNRATIVSRKSPRFP